MYFVSDRKGGFGGLDIWLSIIDENGNFGVPINAGPNVNSENDEITPFYNLWKNEIYFSSNKNKERGFDIYKSKGKLNLWESSTPITELNTEHNELYLNFFKENEGFLASNREGINECNDIFSFTYKSPNKPHHHTLNAIKYLPLCLYFHNDEPDCCTMKTTTEKTYQDTYVSYFKMEEEYFKISKDEKVASFFSDSLRENYNKLNLILREILTELIEGKKIQIEVKGYASPLYETQYNINLSKRRIKSFENFICFYNSRIFVDYLESGALQIIITPFGESKSSEKTSSDPKKKEESIYGINAMLERKIEITNIIFQ